MFRLGDRVSGKWREMGLALGIELNTLDIIQEDQVRVTKCWQEVMRRWMKGEGADEGYPATWEGLYKLLYDVGMSMVAKELKKAVANAIL